MQRVNGLDSSRIVCPLQVPRIRNIPHNTHSRKDTYGYEELYESKSPEKSERKMVITSYFPYLFHT
jgi:hypothetical protein